MKIPSTYRTNLAIKEAVEILLEYVAPPAEESIPITHADGRVPAHDIVAREMMPPFARSPYDGYAFRGEDTQDATKERPVVLRIIEEIRAGDAPAHAIGSGEAAKILTGGPVPIGANATIKYEHTVFDEHTVSLSAPVAPNTDVVPAGEDIALGDLIAQKGELLTPAHIGLLAGLGVAEVDVFQAPSVAIVSTGNELLDAHQPLEPAKIRNSSYYALRAYLQREGVDVRGYRQVPDTVDAVARAIVDSLSSADVVLTTGGVSVGDYDVVLAAVESIGATILFWKLQMKPGSALLAAEWNGKIILGLSGNPTAAALGLHMVALPFLRARGGRQSVWPQKIQVALLKAFTKQSDQHRLIPGRLVINDDGKACFERAKRQGNGVLSSLIGCDIVGEIPQGSPPLAKGALIQAYRIG